MDLLFRRNLSARLDWARAFSSVGNKVERGDSETHLAFTVLY